MIIKKDLRELLIKFLTGNIQDKKYFLEKTILDILKNGIKKDYLDSIKKKEMKIFLKFLENKNKIIRKFSLILISLILSNKYNKKKFCEISDLNFFKGKIFFSDLKNISKIFKNDLKIFLFLKKIENLKNSENEKIDEKILFWYLPLNFKKNENLKNIKIKYFLKNDIFLKENKLFLENIPDPIKIFSGFEIFKKDLKISKKKIFTKNSKNLIKRKTYDIFYKKKSLKKFYEKKNYFQNKIWTTINKKKDSILTKKKLNILKKNKKNSKFKEKTKKKFFKKKNDLKKNLKSFLKISTINLKNSSPLKNFSKVNYTQRTPDFSKSQICDSNKYEFSYY